MVVGLVQFREVVLGRAAAGRPRPRGPACGGGGGARRSAPAGRRRDPASTRSRGEQVVQALVDEQLVVVEVEERVDPVALEDEVADRRLAEEIALPQLLQLPVTGERVEELRLERGAGAAGVEIGEERILGIVEDDRGVEPGAEPLGQRPSCRGRSGRRWRDSGTPSWRGSIASSRRRRLLVRFGCVRVESLTLAVVRLPLVRPFETSFGRTTAREFVLVAVSAGGLTGWGECVADVDPFYTAETTATAWHVMSQYLVPAMIGAEFAHAAELAGEVAARARPPDGQGRARDGRVGPRGAAGGEAAVRAPRRGAAADRVRRLDRHPRERGRARRPRAIGTGRRLPAHQDQDQAGLGPGADGSRPRGVPARSR